MAVGHFIDRRQNPGDKSLGNRQRFMRRAKTQLKKALEKAIHDRKIGDMGQGENVEVPIDPKAPEKGIGEPRIRQADNQGQRHRVLPGNKEFVPGDKISKPPKGGQGVGKEGAPDGEGEDAFTFALTREEFLELFFEDLELPDLVKMSLRDTTALQYQRAGFATDGTPANLDVMRTMRNSFGRRLALQRPTKEEVTNLEMQIKALEQQQDDLGFEDRAYLEALKVELEEIQRRQKIVAYIDPVDVRYRNREAVPKPITKAVMFCLMDVSYSMGEREKDLAKRFFVLLHLFLKRRYEHIDLVFIRHTHEAQEVDEDTFFYSRQSGGTKISTALAKMMEIIQKRYPTDVWNIYAAQASDGENLSGDSEKCSKLLMEEMLPICQYYAYIEILDECEAELFGNPEKGAALWQEYRAVSEGHKNFAMKRVTKPADIYPVFRELFLPAGKAT